MTEQILSGRETIVVAKEQVSCNLDGEFVILHLRAGVYFGLNEVASRIWTLVQEPRTIQQIKAAVLAEYDVDPERCERDVLTLLHELATRELIKVQHETPS